MEWNGEEREDKGRKGKERKERKGNLQVYAQLFLNKKYVLSILGLFRCWRFACQNWLKGSRVSREGGLLE